MPFSRMREKVADRPDEGCNTMPAPHTIRARSLRRTETEAEHKLWLHLRDRRLSGHKFVRQLPVGPFFADFACREASLIVELDGSQHAESTTDGQRDAFLSSHGFAVLRFWNHEVFTAMNSVRETILAAVERRLEPFDRYVVPSSGASRHLLPGGEKGRPGTDERSSARPSHQDTSP